MVVPRGPANAVGLLFPNPVRIHFSRPRRNAAELQRVRPRDEQVPRDGADEYRARKEREMSERERAHDDRVGRPVLAIGFRASVLVAVNHRDERRESVSDEHDDEGAAARFGRAERHQRQPQGEREINVAARPDDGIPRGLEPQEQAHERLENPCGHEFQDGSQQSDSRDDVGHLAWRRAIVPPREPEARALDAGPEDCRKHGEGAVAHHGRAGARGERHRDPEAREDPAGANPRAHRNIAPMSVSAAIEKPSLRRTVSCGAPCRRSGSSKVALSKRNHKAESPRSASGSAMPRGP